MGRGESAERAVKRAVELTLVAGAVTDEREQRRLKRVLRDLRREIGVSVPKRRAAGILGVSVTALDKWIALGRLPTVRRPGSSRAEIDTDALLDLAEEVKRLRENGVTRGVLAAAFERLAKDGKPRRRLRPNMPARELRADFLGTTPADRLRTGAELSYAGSILAAYGRERRTRTAG